MICPSCGKEIGGRHVLCPECGAKVARRRKPPALIPYRRGKKWGFCDSTKKMVLPTVFDEAYAFSDGLAAVELGDQWGFIDGAGNVVIPVIYASVEPFSKGVARVCLDWTTSYEKDGTVRSVLDAWTCIDTEGKGVAWPAHDDAEDSDGGEIFREGLTPVEVDGKWGFMNRQGDMVIPAVYDRAESFSEGLASVKVNGKWGFIDARQTTKLLSLGDCSGSVSEGLAPVQVNGKRGWVDRNRGMAIPAVYAYVCSFSGGLAQVRMWERGYIDSKGTQYWEN